MENKNFLARVKANREAQQERWESIEDTICLIFCLILMAFLGWFGAWMFF